MGHRAPLALHRFIFSTTRRLSHQFSTPYYFLFSYFWGVTARFRDKALKGCTNTYSTWGIRYTRLGNGHTNCIYNGVYGTFKDHPCLLFEGLSHFWEASLSRYEDTTTSSTRDDGRVSKLWFETPTLRGCNIFSVSFLVR